MTRRRIAASAAAGGLLALSALFAGCASPDTNASDAAIEAVRPTTTTTALPAPSTVSPTTTTTTTRVGVPCVQGQNETSSFAPPQTVSPSASRIPFESASASAR